jgi:hypothetical protein
VKAINVAMKMASAESVKYSWLAAESVAKIITRALKRKMKIRK